MAGRATPQPDELAERLLRLLPRLQQWAATTVQADGGHHGLSLRQFAVVYMIREGVASPGEIARRLRVTPAVVTGLLDRLEQRGFVRRAADPDDRRRSRLRLTETGQASCLAIKTMLTGDLSARFGSADPADREALALALALLERTATALERTAPTFAPLTMDDEPWNEPAAARSAPADAVTAAGAG